MSAEVLNKMISALGLEVQAIKKKGQSTRMELRGGEFKGHADDRYLYSFPVTEDISQKSASRLKDDSPVRLVIGRKEVDGVIVAISESVALIALIEDMGPRIPQALLVCDDSFLVERLKDVLSDIVSGKASFNHAKADQTLGLASVTVKDDAVAPIIFQGVQEPNPEQKKAIAKALGSEVTFIWGPPGTGKTSVLARIVEAFYGKGLSVLLVSNTNIAVDTALEKVAQRLATDIGFQQGAVIRHGTIVKPELNEIKDKVSLEGIVARLAEKLQSEKTALEQQRKQLSEIQESILSILRNYEILESANAELQNARATTQSITTKKADATSNLDRLNQDTDILTAELQKAQNMGTLKRLFLGANPEKIRRGLGEIALTRVATQAAIAEMDKQFVQLKQKIKEKEPLVRDVAAKLAKVPPLEKCRNGLASCQGKLEPIVARLAAIQSEIDALRKKIIENCRVLATTAYRTYLNKEVMRSFDVVVMDEASMLPLPLAYYVSGMAVQKVVVAGDFRQLPPIILSEDKEAIEWLKQDVFHKAGIAEAVRRRETPEGLACLTTQYRMHEDICALVNELFYDKRLKTDQSVRTRVARPFPLGDSRFLILDTSQLNPWASMKLGGFSRYNLLHALLIRNMACLLGDRGYLPIAAERNEALGIMSPYTAQTALLQSMLNERFDGEGSRYVATVHRFQGNEKDAIIIDLTDSLGVKWISKFLRASDIDEDGVRLLNVAFSRARNHVILVANLDYLRAKLPASSATATILDHFLPRALPISLDEVFHLGPEEWVDGLKPIAPPPIEFDANAAGIFSEGTFYPAFWTDLNRARESIVLFSFLGTRNGVGRWMDLLRSKVAAGVHVRFVMEPSDDAEFIEEIRTQGVVVDLRDKMHEKLALIDGCILWIGSLNILSHRDRSEIMIRMPSAAACGRVARFISTPMGKRRGDGGKATIAEKENPDCPACGHATLWKNGRFGPYFVCLNCGGKTDARTPGRLNKPKSSRKPRQPFLLKSNQKVCPECGSQMIVRSGKRGDFWGCSKYPRCRHTASI